ncbi:Ig-like domain-containing protein [Kitasatospora sp. LaBMicrA B282]|uniref:Ig-like domain-containing protein n=1 Tax=Kitasatospora sp. LaBMicrA B282 TaxID=3420949 RepID=UPI003D0999CA
MAANRTARRIPALLLAAVLGAGLTGGIAHADTVTSGFDTSSGTGSIGPSGGPGSGITRDQIIARAQDWVGQGISYSQNQGWQDAATGGPYRTDCSGFVSMAWGLPSSMVTSTLPQVATVTASNISGDTNINPGDALDYTADHVVLFDHWTDSSGDFAYDAEHTEGQPTNQSTDSIYSSTLEGFAISNFEALQYNNLTASIPAPATPSVSVTGPGNGAAVTGSTTLSASASDSTGGAALSTQFSVDGVNVGAAQGGSNPSVGWNPGSVSPGRHTVTATTTASNGSGSAVASSSVSVEVFGRGSAGQTFLDQNGKTLQFQLGSNGNAFQDYQTVPGGSPWSGWGAQSPLPSGVTFTAAPQGLLDVSGKAALYAPASDGNVYENYQTAPGAGPWSGWHALSGLPSGVRFSGAVAGTLDAGGRLALYATGSNGNVYENYQTVPGGAPWSGWHETTGSAGVALAAGPVAFRDVNNKTVLYAVGSNGNVYENYQTVPGGGPWSGWHALTGLPSGVTFTSRIAGGTDANGKTILYVTGSNGNVYENYQTVPGGAPWSGWHVLDALPGGITFGGGPDLFLDAGKKAVLYVRGSDGNVYENYQTVQGGGPWSGWHTVNALPSGVSFTGEVAGTVDAHGHSALYVIGSNGNVYEDYQTVPGGAPWSGWHTVNALPSGITFTAQHS